MLIALAISGTHRKYTSKILRSFYLYDFLNFSLTIFPYVKIVLTNRFRYT